MSNSVHKKMSCDVIAADIFREYFVDPFPPRRSTVRDIGRLNFNVGDTSTLTQTHNDFLPSRSLIRQNNNESGVIENKRGRSKSRPKTLPKSSSNIFTSVARIGSALLKPVMDVASTMLFETGSLKEDVLRFNGYTLRVFGELLTLESVEIRKTDGIRLIIWLRVFSGVKEFKIEKPSIEDNLWTLKFTKSLPFEDSFIRIETPMGVNSDKIKLEGPDEEQLVKVSVP